MKNPEIRNKTREELSKLLVEKRKELADKRLKFKMGKVKNTNELKLIRKDIARLLTVIQEKV